MSRILVISDDKALIEALKRHVERAPVRAKAEGLRVLNVSPQKDIVEFVTASGLPDVVLLDLDGAGNLPEAIARLGEALQALRVPDTPVIIRLSAAALAGLDFRAGFTDFVESSAGALEIFTRIRLILWRRDKVDVKDLVRFEDMTIDLANYEVSIRGRPVSLTYKEYELLRFLATHPNKVFTRDRLLNYVWGYDYYGGSRTVDVHIRRLRAKLRDCRKEHIQTLRNIGYKFVP